MAGSTCVRAPEITRRCDQNIVQTQLIIWINKNVDDTNNDHQNILEQLELIANRVIICKESDRCIQYLNEMKEDKAFIIISDNLDQNLLANIHGIKQVHNVYYFQQNNIIHIPMTTLWPKVEGVFTDIKPICQSLRRMIQRSNRDAISISFVPKDTVSVATQSSRPKLDQLEPTFMYSVLFKEIILEIKDDDDTGNTKSIDELVTYCRSQNVSETQLNEFQTDYQNQSPIWWYTKSTFLYSMLNGALRTFNTELMIKMSFIIRSIHQQLEKLQRERIDLYINDLIVYRGQGLNQQDFQRILHIKGGLLSFNNFLSTSRDKCVAMAFAESITEKDIDVMGIIFTMTIYSNQMSIINTPFANIDEYSGFPQEEEILFSMNTVFRVEDIKQSVSNRRLWEIQLTLTDVNDSELASLTKRMRDEIDGEGWSQVGQLMLKVGHFDQAEILYNELLKNASNESERSKIIQRLGETMFYQGKYQETIVLCEKALQIKHNSALEIDCSFIDSYNYMGRAYCKMGNYMKALEFYEKAYKTQETFLPSNHPSLALSYRNVGLLYDNTSDYGKALEFYEKAYKIQEAALPSNHPDLAASYGNVGMVYDSMGDYPKAIEFYEKSYEIQETVLPSNHPDLANSYNNIGVLYTNIGDFPKALQFYEKARKILEIGHYPVHSDLATCYCSIGLVHNYMGDYAKALEFYSKDLEITEKIFSPDHPDLATSYNNVGQVYYNMGEYSKALEYHSRSLKIWEVSLPPNHPNLSFPYIWFGRIYRSLKDYPKSLDYFETCLSIRERNLSKSHPLLAVAYCNIGDIHRLMHDYGKALQFHEKALNIQEKVECDPTTCATTYVYLGEMYSDLKNYKMALTYLDKALQIRQQKLPTDHPDLAVVYHDLSKVYHSLNEYDLAVKNIEQAIEISEKKLPPTHLYLMDYRETFEKICKKM